jgi:alkylation response protein AidB-like acyl-CoA dehydrogenase
MQKLVLNEEQQMLRDAANGLFQEQGPVSLLRKLRDSGSEPGYDPDFWKQAVELGLAGTLVPEAQGGSAFGHVGMGQVMEENGRTLTPSPLFATAIVGATALMLAGSEQQQSLLADIGSGQRLMALAIDEQGRHQPQRVAATAEAHGDGFILNGSKTFVVDGHIADTLIVSARTAGNTDQRDGISLFLVDAGAEGVTVNRTTMVDTHNAARVTLENVPVAGSALLGEAGKGMDVLEPLLDIANAHIAAELLGVASEAFKRTLSYMQERKQFGALIGSFQALQHRAAALWSELELLKSCVLKALMALDAQDPRASELVSVAKAKACKVAELATNEGIQLHGGMGMTDEYDIGLFLKRARPLQLLFGDQRYHADRFARLRGF